MEIQQGKIAPSNEGEHKAHSNVLLRGLLLSFILWAIGGGFAWQSFQNENERATGIMQSLGTNLAYHTSVSVKNADGALVRVSDRFSRQWDYLNSNPLTANDFLISSFSGLDQLRDVIIMGTTGETIFSHRFDYEGASEAEKDDFTLHLLLNPQNHLFIGNMFSKNSIGLSRPIYNRKGKLLGYVLAKISSDYLTETYQIGLQHDQHRFALYSPNGRLFSIPENYPFEHNVLAVIHGKEVQTTLKPNSQNHNAITTLTKVPDYDLVVSAEIPHEAVIADWKKLTIAYAIIGIVFSAIILISSTQVHRTLGYLHREIETRRKAENSLKKISQAVEQSPASVIITDTFANIEYVNPKFTETSGYSLADIVGQNPRILSSGKVPKTDYTNLWETLLKGEEWRGEFHNKHKDGSFYWESALISAIKNADGEITHFLAVKEDITLRKQSEDQLELATAVFDAASEAIMVCDEKNAIEMVNSSFTEITGFALEEVIGQSPSLLKSGRHNDAFYKEMIETLHTKGRWEGEIWNRRKNGEIYPQWLSIKTTLNEEGEVFRYISLFSDITHRKRNEERILYQANYDALTGLPNRSLFLDRLQRAVIRAERSKTQIALLFIDLDRFKNVNDSLGHAYGDLLLQEAASRLTACVRKTDTVARLGGDEFTVVIQDLTDFYLIESLVEKVLEQLSAPYSLEQNIAFVSASIGITIFPNDGANVEELLKNADSAMYRAKENGRNLSQFFTAEMNNQATERRALETALHQALEREEFALHYQPIVDTKSGHVSSCEALLRWHQPEHGNVFPDKFIPLAEDTGLILPIGEWVLLTACREAMIWSKGNPNPPNISVNMSSRQFQRLDVVALVKETLAQTGLPAERLTLEITESLLVGDDQTILEQLHGIRKLGIGLSIDDFGTGYSSLSYLRRFPITTLKIDRSFINDVTTNQEAAALVAAILSMAQSLKLKVVAEGVETFEQLEHLRQGKCEYIQGYYFSPPVPVKAFRKMAKKDGPLEPDQ